MDRALFLVPALKSIPETGGEHFNLELSKGLSRHFDLCTVGFQDLPGFARDPNAYLAAIQRFWDQMGPFELVIQDDYVYPFAALANEWLSKRTNLIGFGQAIYSERYDRPWVRWKHDRDLAKARKPYNGLIVVSETMLNHAIRHGFPKQRVEAVRPGYSPNLADSLPVKAPTSFRVVSAGSYQPAKGQMILVQAMVNLLRARPDLSKAIRLDLYGNKGYAPKYVQDIEDLITHSGYANQITLHDSVAQSELWSQFQEAHVFAFLAQGEGIGMVTIEAMAHGCVPVIANDDLSRELLGDPPAGVAIHTEPAYLEQVLMDLIDRRERWEELSARAFLRGRTMVRSWDLCIDEFASAILRLVR